MLFKRGFSTSVDVVRTIAPGARLDLNSRKELQNTILVLREVNFFVVDEHLWPFAHENHRRQMEFWNGGHALGDEFPRT